MSHLPHNKTTYAEGARVCKICGDEFKLHRFNRFRETCGKDCFIKLQSLNAKNQKPDLDKLRGTSRHRSLGFSGRGGDPRDEEILVQQLFTMTWRPCEACHGTSWTRVSTYQWYCSNRSCRKSRNPRAGTIFDKTQTPLALWVIIMRRQAATGYKFMRVLDVARDFGMGRNSAMRILQRIRYRDNDDPYIRWALHPELPPIKGVLVKELTK